VSQNTFVPDDNFEQALINLGYDVGPLDDFVPTANISGIANLDVSANNITDLTGVQDFTALSILDCSDNFLTNINLNQNINLTQLFVQTNQISSVDVSLNSGLQILWCFQNQLSAIDITNNPSLISLVCNDNNLTSIDTSNNTNLNVFVCDQNQITNLDVSNNVTLNRFECGNNLLSDIDVRNNTSLSFFSCEANQLTTLDVTNNRFLITLFCSENQIVNLDLSQNNALTNLNCSSNQLCDLNIKNGNNNNIILMDFSSNLDLNCVVVDNSGGNQSTWIPNSFSNYVNLPNDCSDFVLVDSLNDFIGVSFTLPPLLNGNYFTESGGNGASLNSGDVISSSQTIYIYNETTCHSNESSFSVLITDSDYYIPKYFTPNNDGTHDFWQVLDNTNTIESINIFNKQGKLLKYLPTHSVGWNGTFNGQLMPTDDYWYLIKLKSGEQLRGHFTLKR
jgi:gliding motility-associated-like protein